MCEFISWIERKGKILYLNDAKLRSPKGKKFLEENEFVHEDINGHGAIVEYYGLRARWDGIHRELSYFGSPSQFPEPIREDIKKGNFTMLKADTSGVENGVLLAEARERLHKEEDGVTIDYIHLERDYEEYNKELNKLLWSYIKDPNNRRKIWQ